MMIQTNYRMIGSNAMGQDYQTSFKQRAAGKVQLKEFFKFTHPDFFQSAPAEVKAANAESVQNLNAYLQSVQTANQKV